MLAAGAATGVLAVTKTTGLGAQTVAVSEAEIAKREAELDRLERRIAKALKSKPPKLRLSGAPDRAPGFARTMGGAARLAYVTYTNGSGAVAASGTGSSGRSSGTSAAGAGQPSSGQQEPAGADEGPRAGATPSTETHTSPTESGGTAATQTESSPTSGGSGIGGNGGDGGSVTSTHSSPTGGGGGSGEHKDDHEEKHEDDHEEDDD